MFLFCHLPKLSHYFLFNFRLLCPWSSFCCQNFFRVHHLRELLIWLFPWNLFRDLMNALVVCIYTHPILSHVALNDHIFYRHARPLSLCLTRSACSFEPNDLEVSVRASI